MIVLLILVIFPAALILAAVSDVATMKISNWISIVLVTSFAILAFAAGMAPHDIGWHFAAGTLMLVLGFSLFAFNFVGGGDVKILAASALWFGWGDLFSLVLYSAVLGAPLCLFLLGFRNWPLPEWMEKMDWINQHHRVNAGVPYGVAICAAGLILYSETPMMNIIAGQV